MKIAILTQPLGHNYGGLLQAYALQQFLREQGFDVETIDRRTNSSIRARLRAKAANSIRFALGRIKTVPSARKRARMLAELARFADRHLTISPRITSDRALEAYCRRNAFEAFIVGSDQVWRPRYSPNLSNFFLDFLGESITPARCLSYAASFGVDQWEFSHDQTARCRRLLQRFDAVSVRERSGVDLCRDHLGREARQMPDPTFLLSRNIYENLIDDATACASSPPGAVLAYLLDEPQRKADFVRCATNELEANSFSIKPLKGMAQVTRQNFHECVYPSVSTWLKSFRDARFVVTDSFHGVLFSIIFNTPFIAIGNPERGLSRFESLLSSFNLEHRLVEYVAEVTPSLINERIDWASVNTVRERQQAAGSRFLIDSLSESANR